jgi:hypothetical protein
MATLSSRTLEDYNNSSNESTKSQTSNNNTNNKLLNEFEIFDKRLAARPAGADSPDSSLTSKNQIFNASNYLQFGDVSIKCNLGRIVD